jgi:hypothetical protein
MAKFTITDQQPTPAEPEVRFTAEIDDDGDFNVKANGELAFYVSHNTGKLHRYHGLKVKGIVTDGESDQIAVD